MEKVGIIGVGNMGLSMAKARRRGGCQVLVYDTRRERVDNLLGLGAAGAGSPHEVAELVEVVLLSLPNSSMTEQVVLGERGVLAGVGNRSLMVDMGSCAPSSTRMLGARLAEKRARMLSSAADPNVRKRER